MKGKYITLYHFCAEFCVRSILENGLTMGITPIWEGNNLHIEKKTQWLTSDGAPDHQSWNTKHLLPYSRTAYRFTINIPYSHRKKLILAKDFVAQCAAENASLVLGWSGSENWYIFQGIIPPAWIVGYKRMEGN